MDGLNGIILAISGSVILILIGIVSFFCIRLINKLDDVIDTYSKFFGEKGEKEVIWDRLDTLTRDSEWAEYTIKSNIEKVPAKRKIHRHKIDR